MDYLLENIEDGRFQELCQSLLIKEFPNIVCFPIGQRDGGRDAISYTHFEKSQKQFIIFQVKQTKRQVDPIAWLKKIIKDEAPKVNELASRGATAFYLITNLHGTAFPEAGSMDQINKILGDAIEMPSTCWWRDDLNRRLDNAWDLKWAYPEIMSGVDMFRYVLENGLIGEDQRLISIVRAFTEGQYEKDEFVRFKQGDLLKNDLFKLFIDVPLTFRAEQAPRVYWHFRRVMALSSTNEEMLASGTIGDDGSNVEFAENYYRTKAIVPLAARVLLHPAFQIEVPQIVLEGAPGQGKSTIVQYICQMHRIHLLNELIENISSAYRPLSLRLPIKIDLRDFATWLDGQDPFSSIDTKEKPDGWHKSLEAFLAHQIKYDSGGNHVSVDDLHAIAHICSLLLVLDGFDEVADISKRNAVVKEVTSCVKRLRAIAASLQVIITSRPAAFANSPGFSEKLFPHFELGSLTIDQVNDYATRWISAQKLDNRESNDIKRILKEKLTQPHLRDLARNPMQLAILLTLIHHRGRSLPDQRTALYDSYVERFFDRESDKNEFVRDNRNILIDIHGYLAWILHSEAEQGRDRRSMTIERMEHLLTEYLQREEADIEIAHELSVKTVERIFFLVARVQGTFEFEVQPLREYFTARYLYRTAPRHPIPGVECHGTILDRFEAISMNFYWLNVTRFYAGFYNPGELPSLVYQLQDLANKDGFDCISHPKVLAATLLSDSVFAQHRRAMKDVLSLVLDKHGIRYFSAVRERSSVPNTISTLPKDCGQTELVRYCFDNLAEEIPQDYATLICNIIKANSMTEENKQQWLNKALAASGVERTKWMQYGFLLGAMHALNNENVNTLLSDEPKNVLRISYLFRTGQLDKTRKLRESYEVLINAALDNITAPPAHPAKKQQLPLLEQFISAINIYRYLDVIEYAEHSLHVSLSKTWDRSNIATINIDNMNLNKISSYDKKALEVLKVLQTEQHRSLQEWVTELDPWDNLVEVLRSNWGERCFQFYLANMAGALKADKKNFEEFSDLLDHSKSLCKRVCHAKSKANTPHWWKEQADLIKTELDRFLFLLEIFIFGGNNSIYYNISIIDDIIRSISDRSWRNICSIIENFLLYRSVGLGRHNPIQNINKLPQELSERTVVTLGLRTDTENTIALYKKFLFRYTEDHPLILNFCQKAAFELAKVDPEHWEHALTTIAFAYAKRVILFNIRSDSDNKTKFPIVIARKIAENPEKYPRSLVLSTEEVLKETVEKKIIPVGDIAKEQLWFDEG